MMHNTEIARFSFFVVINPVVATAGVCPPVLPGTAYPIAEVFGKGYHSKYFRVETLKYHGEAM